MQGLSQASDGKFEDDKKNEEQFKGDLPENGKINVLFLGNDSRGEAHSKSQKTM
ncbi:hypothetical protein QUF84_26220 [Fictibacillus enclensis]|uniref:hypothetical protein n=1 Tax=Fictibacillus enclensis TaxID=1017270 RepID=UPI0025A20598|nr:hypothetical protein [Fictibacillus enclensis]MDM5340688.1 hypothetical protein [Fictibacillus enclensis]